MGHNKTKTMKSSTIKETSKAQSDTEKTTTMSPTPSLIKDLEPENALMINTTKKKGML